MQTIYLILILILIFKLNFKETVYLLDYIRTKWGIRKNK
jgi:hypothetical protein